MRWLIAAGVLLIIIAMVFKKDKKRQDVDRMMKKVRAAKARKAKERAKQARAQMKVA